MSQLANLRLLVPLSPFRTSSSLPLFSPWSKHKSHSLFTVLASSSSRKNRNFPTEHLNLGRRNSTTLRKDTSPPMKDSETVNFNKRRAEGRDGDAMPKRLLEPKSRKLNPINTIAYVQILGTGMDTQDTSPSVLLFFDNLRFIFNAGEGLQRFCTEHKIKLSKIDYIFLSRVCSETAGGLPGLLLSLAGIGEEGMSVNVWGPSDIKLLVNAMKSFIPNAAMVYTKSFDSPVSVLIDNEIVKISAILLLPGHSKEHSLMDEEHLKIYSGDTVNDGPRQHSPNPNLRTSENIADISVVYVCELPEIPGKFHPDRARAHGIKAGPKYRQLQLGISVKSDSGDKMVHPSDVMDISIPGPIVILVDCPTESHLEALLSSESLNDYYGDCMDKPSSKTVTCIIHLSPTSIVRNSKYQEWMRRFSSTQHIMAGHDKKNVEIPILKSSARIAARLNFLCPHFFPAPGFWSLSNDKCSKSNSPASCEGSVSELHSSISVDNLLKFTLRPHAHIGLDRSCIPSTKTSSEIISELLSEIPETVEAAEQIKGLWQLSSRTKEDMPCNQELMVEEPWLSPYSFPNCLEDVRRDDLEIVLLGTGSSQPSKYRNVSSIYLNLFSNGSLLLDCGEGTLGQLKRRYSLEGADNAVRNLKCIWISHIHADHHTGLARILALRRDLLKGVPHEPVLVVGPRQLKRYLDAYQRLEDLDMQFLDCKHTTEYSLEVFENDEAQRGSCPGSPIDSQDVNSKFADDSNLFSRGSPMQSYWKRSGSPPDKDAIIPTIRNFKKIIQEAGLETLISVPVVHCPQAFGVVIKAADRTNNSGKVIPGWKIVYSGDTRPCAQLVEASRDATVLIHEATFEDGMLEEAIAKNHSTTKEAVEVGDSAGAYRIILTHFSQRYPKIPVFSETHMHKTCIAFDMMSVNVADLPLLPKVVPYLKLLFKNEMMLDESDDVVNSAIVAA